MDIFALAALKKANEANKKVSANPTLAGTEAELTGLEVDGIKYKVPSGGGAGTLYAVCNTSVNVQTKTVTIPEVTEYYEGLTIKVRFPSGSATDYIPKLQVNNLDALSIYTGSPNGHGIYQTLNGHWRWGIVITFVCISGELDVGLRWYAQDMSPANDLYDGLVKVDGELNPSGAGVTKSESVAKALSQLAIGAEPEVYDPTSTYTANSYVWHDNILYKAKQAISTAEAWNASHWIAVTSLCQKVNEATPPTMLFWRTDKSVDVWTFDIVDDPEKYTLYLLSGRQAEIRCQLGYANNGVTEIEYVFEDPTFFWDVSLGEFRYTKVVSAFNQTAGANFPTMLSFVVSINRNNGNVVGGVFTKMPTDVFSITYGTTTYAEIMAAIQSGKYKANVFSDIAVGISSSDLSMDENYNLSWSVPFVMTGNLMLYQATLSPQSVWSKHMYLVGGVTLTDIWGA